MLECTRLLLGLLGAAIALLPQATHGLDVEACKSSGTFATGDVKSPKCPEGFKQVDREEYQIQGPKCNLPNGLKILVTEVGCECKSGCNCKDGQSKNAGYAARFASRTTSKVSGEDIPSVMPVVQGCYDRYLQRRKVRSEAAGAKCTSLRLGESSQTSSALDWPTPDGHGDALESNKKEFLALLEKSFNSVEIVNGNCPLGCGKIVNSNPKKEVASVKPFSKMNCCQPTKADLLALRRRQHYSGSLSTSSCTGDLFKPRLGYTRPVMWNEDAVSPPKKNKWVKIYGCHKPASMPEHAQLARISPCFCNDFAFCAIIKVTQAVSDQQSGASPLVAGWGKITPAADVTEQMQLGASLGPPPAGLESNLGDDAACSKVKQQADSIIRKSVADLRFQISQNLLSGVSTSFAAALESKEQNSPSPPVQDSRRRRSSPSPPVQDSRRRRSSAPSGGKGSRSL